MPNFAAPFSKALSLQITEYSDYGSKKDTKRKKGQRFCEYGPYDTNSSKTDSGGRIALKLSLNKVWLFRRISLIQ